MFEKSANLKVLFMAIFAVFFILPSKSGTSERSGFKNLKVEEEVQDLMDQADQYIRNDNDSALIFINKAKKKLHESGSDLQKVKLIELEGNYWGKVKSNYNKATQLFLSGIKICEENKLDYSKNIYHSLGVLFHITDNYSKAKGYYTKALQLAKQAGDTLLMVRCMVNLGSVNSSMENFQEAEKLYLQSLKLPSNPHIRRSTLVNIGNLNIREKKFHEAIQYLNQAIRMNPEFSGDDALDFSYLLNAKSAVGDFNGIDSLLPQCISICNECNDLRNKTILLRSIGDMYVSMSDYQNASRFKDRYIQAYDSLKNQQRDEVVYELETQYQTQKKEEEIIKQQKSKTTLLILVFVFISLSLLLTWLVISNLRQKKRLSKQKVLLEILIEEKNLLLRETHHRVKNSFQIVSGLLYLQSENMKDKDAALAIKEAQNRVKSMVLIHQKLYNKDQLIGIETQEYIQDLVNDIVDNQTDTIENLRTEIDVDSAVFSIDTITPIGLIINELITNCIKHAFDASIRNPVIKVTFKRSKDVYLLKIQDNGKGLKEEIKESSFGIKLIKALSKKLKAKIDFENNGGTVVTMEICKFDEMN